MAGSVYQYVTDRIISELEKGNIPWKNPWKGQKAINYILSQIEGIETKLEPFNPDNSHDSIDQAESIINQYINKESITLNIITGLDMAYYSPDNDQVVLPSINQFVGNTEYYSTAFHELTHSTGHKKRLDRFANMKSHKFGSQDYLREELIAEIGSVILCNSTGIEIPDTFKNSVAYIQGWLKVLKNDVRLITIAAGQANKAVNYILGIKDSEKVENN